VPLQVVLTMCKQQKLEPAILQLLKRSLVQGYEQQQRGRGRWLPSLAGNSGTGTSGAAGGSSSNKTAAGGPLAAALLQAIR
jgi:lysophospholipase L1-like esterase